MLSFPLSISFLRDGSRRTEILPTGVVIPKSTKQPNLHLSDLIQVAIRSNNTIFVKAFFTNSLIHKHNWHNFIYSSQHYSKYGDSTLTNMQICLLHV